MADAPFRTDGFVPSTSTSICLNGRPSPRPCIQRRRWMVGSASDSVHAIAWLPEGQQQHNGCGNASVDYKREEELLQAVAGWRCYETPTRGFKVRKGDIDALPPGTMMRAVATGSSLRHVLAVIIHDAAQVATMRIPDGEGPKLGACK